MTLSEMEWAIVAEDTGFQLQHQERARLPEGHEGAGALTWFRRRFIELLSEHRIRSVCIRTAEGNARKQDTWRTRLEGVLLEAAASSGLEVACGPYSKLGKLLGRTSKELKQAVAKSQDFGGIDLSDHSRQNAREAILWAAGAARAQELE